MNDIRRVLVVGGGVGGLTAATAFARRGVEVVLIERRPAFDVPGVGLGQPANALRVYDALGLLPEILASGFAYDRMSIFGPKPGADCRAQIPARRREGAGVLRAIALTLARDPAGCRRACRRRSAHRRYGQRNSGRERPRDGDILGWPFRLLRSVSRLRRHTLDDATAFVRHGDSCRAHRVTAPGACRCRGPAYVRGMEFLQGVGSKTGAMPLSDNLMYVFHIRPEAPDAVFSAKDYAGSVQGAPGAIWQLRRRSRGFARCQFRHRATARSSRCWCRGRGSAAASSSAATPRTPCRRISPRARRWPRRTPGFWRAKCLPARRRSRRG